VLGGGGRRRPAIAVSHAIDSGGAGTLRPTRSEGITVTGCAWVRRRGGSDDVRRAAADRLLSYVMHAIRAGPNQRWRRLRACRRAAFFPRGWRAGLGKIQWMSNAGIDLYSVSGHKVYAPKGVAPCTCAGARSSRHLFGAIMSAAAARH